MEHVTILVHVLTLLTGSLSITHLSALYRPHGRRHVLSYAVFIGTINFGALMQASITYLSTNLSQGAVMPVAGAGGREEPGRGDNREKDRWRLSRYGMPLSGRPSCRTGC